jgi:diguanylate cyclase (GGDEF)-like protein/PAS domain S-box-containing protein
MELRVSHSAFELGALAGALPALLALVCTLRCFSVRLGVHRAAFEQATDSVLLVDARTLEIVDASRALRRSTSYTRREILGLPISQLLEDRMGEPGSLLRRLGDPWVQLPAVAQQRSKSGQVRTVEVSGHRIELNGRALLALTLSELPTPEARSCIAGQDLLTGLPNRYFLAAQLPVTIEQSRSAGHRLAVLFLDFDHFNHVNDARGHQAGDKLIRALAERLRASVPADDLVVRMGSDEFVIVVRSVQTLEGASALAARIKEALAMPVTLDGRDFITTASIGLSLYPRDGTNAGELLRSADTARYQSKAQGGNTVEVFSPAMGQRLEERIAMESSLRTALQRGQLEVYYQPILDIRSYGVVALEALLRWKHPVHGFVSPDRFIPVAEETGMIVPIGEFVIERVMGDIARWELAGCTTVPVAVNISAVQLQRTDLAATICRLGLEFGVSPEMLQVELTERAAFEREAAVAGLRQLGVTVALDDFGTGYSSLSYLKHWRVDHLKIDRSFVRDLVTDASDRAIVGAIVAMARQFKIEVVAEGIETWAQLTTLQELGCELAQGHLFAKAIPAAQCRRYLTGAAMQPGFSTPDALPVADPVEEAEPALGLLVQPLPFGT